MLVALNLEQRDEREKEVPDLHAGAEFRDRARWPAWGRTARHISRSMRSPRRSTNTGVIGCSRAARPHWRPHVTRAPIAATGR